MIKIDKIDKCFSCEQNENIKRGINIVRNVDIVSTCMLLFRAYWRNLNGPKPDVHIFTDGSRQWRGVELYASSFDLVLWENGEWVRHRRLFPAIQIGIMMLNRLGKALVLL